MSYKYSNWDKLAASFCCQVPASVADMFCNFYFVKNQEIANNSTTPEAREKISTVWNPLNFIIKNLRMFD
jgi:hypothetical protein